MVGRPIVWKDPTSIADGDRDAATDNLMIPASKPGTYNKNQKLFSPAAGSKLPKDLAHWTKNAQQPTLHSDIAICYAAIACAP
jgi:hypothetical protein